VDASKKFNVHILSKYPTWDSSHTAKSTFDVPEEAWEFFAVSIKMLPDALNSEVGFMMGS
jgi:hypothetical protein